MGMFSRWNSDIGLDLGTANTLVYVQNRGIVANEPSIVAVNAKTEAIIAIGTEAQKMLGKTPAHVHVVKPLQDGIISNFEVAERMLAYFLNNHIKKNWFNVYPRVVVGIPSDVTEVERKAVEDAVLSAGAGKAFLIEEAVAAAIGARLSILEPTGNMVVDIGGGTTEISIISLSGVVASRSLKLGGDKLTENIISYIKDAYGTVVGETTAEDIKARLGTAIETESDTVLEVRGRDVVTGLPREITVAENDVYQAISRSVAKIVDTVKETLEHTPAELSAELHGRGIVLSGGGALLRNMDTALQRVTGIPVSIADDPLTSVVRGTGLLLESSELLGTVTVSTASR